MSDSESEASCFMMSDAESDDDFMEEENVVAKKGKAKAASKKKAAPKKAAPKKTASKGKGKGKTAPLADKSNTINVVDDDEEEEDFEIEEDTKGSGKTIEERYQKKTQLEHILLRPDTYIGSTEPTTESMFVYDSTSEKIVERSITFTPGLFKIFDEIVVNAADNKQRDPNMNELHIEINQEENLMSVKNNGKGIPVEMHKEQGCYVPTLIFGHLLTGSNFDDTEKRTTGGRNGYGAKLANIFSKEFIVECQDTKQGKQFKQVFTDNMGKAGKPTLKEKLSAAEKKKGDWTKISFRPDLARFKMTTLDDDTVALLSKRALDIAGSMANSKGKKLKVFLNGEHLKIKDFRDYVKRIEGVNEPAAYEQVNERWEVGISQSATSTMQQISFVNAINTSKGGGHVEYILNQVTSHLVKIVNKKNKGGKPVKPGFIKNHVCVFVNCLIDNPSFDSQTKDNCTSKPKTFGKECVLSDKFLKQVDRSGIVDEIISMANFRDTRGLKRSGGTKKVRLQGIAKLDDANNAGGPKSADCTLIITEGDSAKTLAMSGLSVVGRDNYGVFPLRGKPLNVRDATSASITKNEEITNMVKILGLKYHTEYNESNIKTLRYGRLMIMADQDHDGSHIKGLAINFIHKFWPSLLDVPGFLQQFITPIVKATKGRASKTFFTLPELLKWQKTPESNGWAIKYYKGLGTSTSEEAKEYFANLDRHEVKFAKLSDDVEIVELDDEGKETVPDKAASGTDLIDMVFRKDRVGDRKNWLNKVDKDTYLDYGSAPAEGVRYSAFINRELILFSRADNMRSIPHLIDGFKPSQRKCLFACFKKNLKKEIKVAQLAGYVGEKSAYHHGEASLHGTITNMAQNFVGSNNVNLLTPSGQFGTRRMGGKDAASPRYIFTKLEKITRTIFHPDDDALLNYLEDDGMSIEPDFYVPVIPLVLVNGSDGIGTGWSSTVPNYCPREIISRIRAKIRGEEAQPLHPKYYGFTGEIAPTTGGKYSVEGRITKLDDSTLLIDELPLKKWTQDYKMFLEGMLHGTDDKKNPQPAEIKDLRENHTDTNVSFTITADPSKIVEFEKFKGGLMGKFKLSTSLSTANMNLFDTNGKITKYGTAEAILSAFYDLRLDYYVKRKAMLVEKLSREKRMLDNKARFIEEVCSGELVVSNRKRKDILADLKERGYELFPAKQAAGQEEQNDEEDEGEVEDDTASDATLAKGYEYLLGMKIWSLTFEKAEKLREQLAEKTKELEELEAMEPSQLWENDLDAIVQALDDRDQTMKELQDKEEQARVCATKNQKKQAASRKKNAAVAKKKAAAKKKRAKGEWDSDLEGDDSEDEDFEKSRKPAAKKAAAKPAAKPAAAAKKKTAAVSKSVLEIADSPAKDTEEAKDEDSVGKKRKESPVKLLEEDLEEEELPQAEPPKKRGPKKAAPKKAPAKKNLELMDSDSEAEEEEKPAKRTTKKPAGKKAPPKKKAPTKKADSSDEEDFEEGSDDDESVEEVKPPPRARAGRARKAVTYTVAESSDEEDDAFDSELDD